MEGKIYTCFECSEEFKSQMSLGRHVGQRHYDTKIYYDKFLKKKMKKIV
jgi:uncharacterized C2H2 Zn-finger protein